MTPLKIRKRRLLVRDGEVIGWVVKRERVWRAYVMARRGFEIVFWVGEGPTRQEAADAACSLAEANDVC